MSIDSKINITFITLACILFGLMGYIIIGDICSSDSKVIKETSEYLYIQKYSLYNKDSIVSRYHKPITYTGIVTNKRTSHYLVGMKVKHLVHQYFLTITYDDEKHDIEGKSLYDSVTIGDTILITEKFYPFHELTYRKL